MPMTQKEIMMVGMGSLAAALVAFAIAYYFGKTPKDMETQTQKDSRLKKKKVFNIAAAVLAIGGIVGMVMGAKNKPQYYYF